MEGLANLNKRAATVFNNNALVMNGPQPSAAAAWRNKMSGKLSYKDLPESVTTLMEKVGLDLDEKETPSSSFMDVDPTMILENMMMLEDSEIGEMLSTSNFDQDSRENKDEKKDTEDKE